MKRFFSFSFLNIHNIKADLKMSKEVNGADKERNLAMEKQVCIY